MGPATRPHLQGDACEPTGEMSKSLGPERDTLDTAFLRRFATQLTAASDVLVQQTGLPRIEGSGVWPIFLILQNDEFPYVGGELHWGL